MKIALLPASLWIILATGFQTTLVRSHAETHCPGRVPSFHPRLVAGALLVVAVKVNQSGPFDFMVDTGSQLNVIDPGLAAQLGARSSGSVNLVATAAVFQAPIIILDSLEAGSLTVTKPLAAVQDLGSIQSADPNIRGVLGENFLAHFDLLIDYPHRLLCLGDANFMQKEIHGEQIPLVTSINRKTDLPFTQPLVVSVTLSATGTRPILLQIDSGSDGSILFAGKKELEEPLLKRAKVQGPEAGKSRRAFAVLPPQDMRLGRRVFPKVSFVTPLAADLRVPDREEDGILATVMFQRVYVSHSDHFIIFNPR